MGASNSSEGRMRWLQPLWDRKRKDTMVRVTAAVKHLLKKKQPVTLSTIREAVRLLFRISMSTNTIQRNPEAYATYLQHRTHRPRMQVQNVALRTVLRSVADDKALSVRARVNR